MNDPHEANEDQLATFSQLPNKQEEPTSSGGIVIPSEPYSGSLMRNQHQTVAAAVQARAAGFKLRIDANEAIGHPVKGITGHISARAAASRSQKVQALNKKYSLRDIEMRSGAAKSGSINSANRQQFTEFFNKHEAYFNRMDPASQQAVNMSLCTPQSRLRLGQNKASFVKMVMKEKGHRKSTIGLASEDQVTQSGQIVIVDHQKNKKKLDYLKSPEASVARFHTDLPDIMLHKRGVSHTMLGSGPQILASSIDLQETSPISNLNQLSDLDDIQLRSPDLKRRMISLDRSRPAANNLSSLSRQQQIVFPGSLAVSQITQPSYHTQLTHYSDAKERSLKQQADIHKMKAVYGLKRKSQQGRESFDSYHASISQKTMNADLVASPIKATEATSADGIENFPIRLALNSDLGSQHLLK